MANFFGDAARRRERQQEFERLRLGERGERDVERGERDVERGERDVERGERDVERGERDVERGERDVERGMGADASGANQAADIFRRAAGLGGHLVVAFIAPVGASNQRSSVRSGDRFSSSLEAEAAAAQAVLRQLIEQATTKPKERVSAPEVRMPVVPTLHSGPPRD